MSLISDIMENVRRFANHQQTGTLDTLCANGACGVVRLDKMNGHQFAGFDDRTEGWSTLVKKCGGQTHPKGVEVVILEMESVGNNLRIQKLRLV